MDALADNGRMCTDLTVLGIVLLDGNSDRS